MKTVAVLVKRKNRFAEVKPEIPLGHEYFVDKDSIQHGELYDTKTDRSYPLSRIWSEHKDGSNKGWMPLDLLKLEDPNEVMN